MIRFKFDEAHCRCVVAHWRYEIDHRICEIAHFRCERAHWKCIIWTDLRTHLLLAIFSPALNRQKIYLRVLGLFFMSVAGLSPPPPDQAHGPAVLMNYYPSPSLSLSRIAWQPVCLWRPHYMYISSLFLSVLILQFFFVYS
jgi:hypothetical protein